MLKSNSQSLFSILYLDAMQKHMIPFSTVLQKELQGAAVVVTYNIIAQFFSMTIKTKESHGVLL